MGNDFYVYLPIYFWHEPQRSLHPRQSNCSMP
jgi:hypothetical protein